MTLFFAVLTVLGFLLFWGIVICLGAAIVAFPVLFIIAWVTRQFRPD